MPISLVVSMLVCLALLALRYKLMPQKARRSSLTQKIKLARILVAAALALAYVGYRLQKQAHSLDGKSAYEPSAMERAVLWLRGEKP